MAENSTKPAGADITTVEALKAAYPDLVASIRNEAAEGERSRIKAIKDMALEGFEDIVESAMFENPITAEQAAVKIINEQKKVGGKYLSDREKDAEDAQTNRVGVDTTEQGSGKSVDEFNQAIDQLFPD